MYFRVFLLLHTTRLPSVQRLHNGRRGIEWGLLTFIWKPSDGLEARVPGLGDSDLLPHGSPNEHETYICRLVMVHHYRKSVLARAIATPITTLTEAEHLNRYHTCAEKRLKLIVGLQCTVFYPGGCQDHRPPTLHRERM